MTTRKSYDSRLKVQVALEALKNQQTIAQIASEYGVHPTQINDWKGQLMREGAKYSSTLVQRVSRSNGWCYEKVSESRIKRITGLHGWQCLARPSIRAIP